MSLYLKITVPPWAAPCLRLQARGTARARPVKVSNSEGTPRHAQGSLTIGTGTPSHMTGGPGRACAWAGQAHGTDEARPGQSLTASSLPGVRCSYYSLPRQYNEPYQNVPIGSLQYQRRPVESQRGWNLISHSWSASDDNR